MLRRITTLLIVSALVVAIHSDVLKCYMCTSLTDEGCDSALTATSLQPVECTGSKIVDWQKKIQQHENLKSIAKIFEVDETLKDFEVTANMACAKTIINYMNQEVTVRMCQTAKSSESFDPCNTMQKKIQDQLLGKMEQCALCLKDACNGMTAISPQIFYMLLSFLALIHLAFYHWA